MPSRGPGYTRGLPAPERRRGLMPLPVLTDEQRKQALEKAAIARKKRAELKGSAEVRQAHAEGRAVQTGRRHGGQDEGLHRVLESLPGVGKVRRARSWSGWTSPPADGSGVSARSSASRSWASSRRSSPAGRLRLGRLFVVAGPSGSARGRSSAWCCERKPATHPVRLGHHPRPATGRTRGRRLPVQCPRRPSTG